jgi:hypothetical protein
MMGRRGRRGKQLPNDLKEQEDILIEREALDRTLWRTHFVTDLS